MGSLGGSFGLTGNANIAIDAATGGLTRLTMKAPALQKKHDPKTKVTPAQVGDKK